MNISEKLLLFYQQHMRELPWRLSMDAYKVWLSEIILQQTRVDQGLSYYQRFVQRFPTVVQLAAASEDEVLKLWQGLGYYSRARNLHHTAKTIVNEFHGKFPSNYKDVIKLKGVGPYTAAAILSISFGQPYAVVDGNVYRVLARLFNIDLPIDSTQGKKYFEQLANEQLLTADSGTYNQAIMEFGALYCVPVNPNCNQCIFKSECGALAADRVALLPVKGKKAKVRNRYFNYYIIKDGDLFIVKKREDDDIWKGMYEFPLLESDSPLADSALLASDFINDMAKEVVLDTIKDGKPHQLSHQKIFARFILMQARDVTLASSTEFSFVTFDELQQLPVPRLLDVFIDENKDWFLS